MTVSPSEEKTLAARQRARAYHLAYQRIADFVKCIRKKMRITQPEFARYLGVSEISVRRWETALGHLPSSEAWRALRHASRKPLPLSIVDTVEKLKEASNGNPVNRRAPVHGALGPGNQENHPA